MLNRTATQPTSESFPGSGKNVVSAFVSPTYYPGVKYNRMPRPANANQRTPLQKMDAQRRYAWCRYYEEARTNHEMALTQVARIRRVVAGEIPQHLKTEMEEMAQALSKPYECPICLDLIPKGELDITNCGHKYCKRCLTTLKATTQPKCAMCRTELWVTRPEPTN
jgi:hypothetical protein